MAKDAIILNEDGSFGIENLKLLQSWKAALIEEIMRIIERKKEGKKVSGWVIVRFVDDAFDFAKIMRKYDEIGKEWMDLDDEERDELNQIFRDELDIQSDKLEEFVEQTDEFSSAVAKYVSFLGTLKE